MLSVRSVEVEVGAAGGRRGEDILRASGLGYTIVRPGPLLEEPGGYKALVFDQGNRIAENMSCADAADVALKVPSTATYPPSCLFFQARPRGCAIDVAADVARDESLGASQTLAVAMPLTYMLHVAGFGIERLVPLPDGRAARLLPPLRRTFGNEKASQCGRTFALFG